MMEEMNSRIWVRLGAYLYGSEEEIKAIKEKHDSQGYLLDSDIQHLAVVLDGDSYIPNDIEIEHFNENEKNWISQ